VWAHERGQPTARDAPRRSSAHHSRQRHLATFCMHVGAGDGASGKPRWHAGLQLFGLTIPVVRCMDLFRTALRHTLSWRS